MKVVHPGKRGQAVGWNTHGSDRRISRMNIHKNARLTPQGRVLLVRRITEEGWRIVDAASAAGISVRQSYRWLARYRSGGEAALADRSSAPHQCQHGIGADRIGEVARLRQQRMSGPAIARELSMPISTVGIILRRLGLGKLAALEPKPAVVRYQRQRPGELIHIDTKKLGRIAAVGHCITDDRRDTARGVGWEALHVCIDDATRLAYSEILADERKASAVGFLERALGWFAGQGVTVERVMTDNGSAYRSHAFRGAVHPPLPTTAQHSLPGGALPPYRGRSFTGRIASASPDAPEPRVRIPLPPAESRANFCTGTGGLGIGRKLHRADGTRRAQS